MVANERIWETGTGAGAGELVRYLPPTESITMKVMAFGIHARLAYLGLINPNNGSSMDRSYVPVDNTIAEERDLQ